MHNKYLHTIFFGAAIFLAVQLVPTSANAETNWRGDGTIYANVPTLQIESEDGTKSQIDRSDVLSELDLVFQARVRLFRNRWSATADIYYFDLEDDDDSSVGPGTTLDRTGLEGVIFTPSLGYRVVGSEDDMTSHVDMYIGGRYLWIDAETNINYSGPVPPGGSTNSESFGNWDGVFGARGRYFLSDRWYIPYFADIGTGQSDSLYQVSAGIAYRFNLFSASAGWRYIKYNIGSDTTVKELDASGPYAGLTFFFD